MKDCTNEFSIIEGVISYFITVVLCYLLTRLFFYILWKKYNGDDKLLKEKTDYFFENYDSVIRFCKAFILSSTLPFVNIFVAVILIMINIGVLVFYLVDRFVTYSWIPKKTKDKLK